MFRFVHLTDPHLGSYRDGRWNNGFLCTMMPDVMGCLRRDLREIAPDFILATGDLASAPTRDAMFAARDLLDWLGYPYYPMGGNHDFVVGDSRKWFLEAFHAHLPEKATYYAFEHEHVRFVVLDPWWQWSDGSLHEFRESVPGPVVTEVDERPRWALPADQMKWLAKELGKSSKPTVIASHYPAIGIPERMRRPGGKDAGSLANGDEVLAILAKHPHVRAVFSGHLHMNVIEVVDGVTHVVTAALPEYPVEYRDVKVYADRMEIETCGLSDPGFAARSLVPGGGWTAGQPQDRSAVVPLT